MMMMMVVVDRGGILNIKIQEVRVREAVRRQMVTYGYVILTTTATAAAAA